MKPKNYHPSPAVLSPSVLRLEDTGVPVPSDIDANFFKNHVKCCLKNYPISLSFNENLKLVTVYVSQNGCKRKVEKPSITFFDFNERRRNEYVDILTIPFESLRSITFEKNREQFSIVLSSQAGKPILLFGCEEEAKGFFHFFNTVKQEFLTTSKNLNSSRGSIFACCKTGTVGEPMDRSIVARKTDLILNDEFDVILRTIWFRFLKNLNYTGCCSVFDVLSSTKLEQFLKSSVDLQVKSHFLSFFFEPLLCPYLWITNTSFFSVRRSRSLIFLRSLKCVIIFETFYSLTISIRLEVSEMEKS
jgi:hypothetical protein